MNVDTDEINFSVKVLRTGAYSPSSLDILGSLVNFGVEVAVAADDEALDDVTEASGGDTDVDVVKKYFNVMDNGYLDVTVTLSTIE
jgi:hypothetical protein